MALEVGLKTALIAIALAVPSIVATWVGKPSRIAALKRTKIVWLTFFVAGIVYIINISAGNDNGGAMLGGGFVVLYLVSSLLTMISLWAYFGRHVE